MPDVESIADELYAGSREDFVPARDELARRSPAELATAIRALPKPTTAAWLVNLVARRHPDDLTRLVELGGALRQAYADRAGDRLRELVRQRHEMLRRLTGDVRSVARAEGYHLAGQVADQVQETFEAALLDAEIGRLVRSGRLAAAARVPPMIGLPVLPARTRPAKPPKPPAGQQRELKSALVHARQRIAETRAARKRAEQELTRVTKTAERAAARVAELAAELQQAREAEETAKQDVADAAENVERTERAVENAQQILDEM